MAKKKKKRGSQPLQSESPRIQQNESVKKPPTLPEDSKCSYLQLKLRCSESKALSASLKLKSSPILSLDESDAKKICVQKNDQVVLFLEDPQDSSSLAGLLIGKVDVSSSLRSPVKNVKRRSHVSAGSCTLQPGHLLDFMFPGDTDTLAPTTPKTPVSRPPPATPQSTPKSGFSFAKGGGGDVLIHSPPFSPASSCATPQARQNTNRVLGAWVVPLSSPLGEDVASVLCQNAKSLHIHVKDEAESKRLPDCSHILKELFLAQTSGRYIHEMDALVVSFKGKPLELQANRIESNMGAAEERNNALLELEMENLSIQDEFPDEQQSEFESQLWTRLRVGLEDPTKAQHLLLHRIDRQTQILFSGSIHEEGGTDAHADSKPTSSIPPTKVVAGLTNTLERLQSLLLTPLLKPERFSKGSLKAPRGVLLHGSSGVGKSSLARQLALDLEREYPDAIRVESVNCASLQSYSAQVGEAEGRLCRIFEQAESGADNKLGTLLVFDDVHLICPKRSGYNPSSDRLAATLLGLLDGIGSASSNQQSSVGGAISNSIVILAITNDPSRLDPALRRPGRLDFEVEVSGPEDAAARADILRFHLEDLGKDYSVPSLTKEECLGLGEMAKGFNGADCMLAVKEAIRIAIERVQTQMSGSAKHSDKSSMGQLALSDLQSAIRKTKPSAIKSITVEIPTVLWSSIGGMETVKEELREAIELPETHGHLFEQLRIPPPRGILLYGPPGCSKTLMARALATEGKMNFLAVKGPELLSKWLGESERALASLFRRARVAAPSIVFFDEVDAIAAERGSGGIGTGGGRLLSQLLTELDGINHSGGVTLSSGLKKNPRVVVVAATNRPDLIDSALMRPGRIDRKIYVGVPDEKSRHRIIEIGLQGRTCSKDVDLSQLAKEEVSGGFSGAELIAVCKDAALLALEEDDSSVTSNVVPSIRMRHMLKAINSMQRQITPEMIKFYKSFKSNDLQDIR